MRSSLIPVYTIRLPNVHVCTMFQCSRPHRTWEKCDENFHIKGYGMAEWQNHRVTEWRKDKANPIKPPLFQSGAIIKGHISSSSLIPVYKIHLLTIHMCTKFQPARPEKVWRKMLMFVNWTEKKNEEIKGRKSNSSLIPVYKIHLPSIYVCTKFLSSWPHSSWEMCDEKFQCWKLGRKKKEEIKTWISSSSLILVHDTSAHCPRVYQFFQSSRPHSSREKCDKKFQC